MNNINKETPNGSEKLNIIDIEPSDDPEVTDEIGEEVTRQLDKLLPYKRQIMITGFIILVLLVVFMGFALGGLKVCSDLDGLLDSEFKCHPSYYNTTPNIIGSNFSWNIQNVHT